MKIAINTRFLLKGKLEGIGWFTYETVRRITKKFPQHEFIFLFDRPYDPEFVFDHRIIPLVVHPPARHPLLWYWWFEMAVPAVLKKYRPDVFFSPDGYCSLKTSCRQVMVVHDLAFEHFSGQVPFLTRWYYRHFTPLYVHKADRIITVSEFTRQDVIKRYGVAPEKITVAYNGGDESFRPYEEDEKQQIRDRYSGGNHYFLYAGALQPRKNIINLLLAYDDFRSQSPLPVKLILAGRNWSYRELTEVQRQMKFASDVILIGHLTKAELSRVMGAALALTYVSLFEGFGIPIVEAMRCDVPVITSQVSSMPEVAGDAALLVDPYSVQSISEAMLQISRDPELCSRLINRGRRQSALFTWQRSADQIWQVLESVADQE